MSDSSKDLSFGRYAMAAESGRQLLYLEKQHHTGDLLGRVDVLIAECLTRLVSGERFVEVSRGRRVDSVQIIGLSNDNVRTIDELFNMESQRSRGAWYLSTEVVSFKAGLVNLAFHLSAHPRSASSIAFEERARLTFEGSPAHLFCSVLLEPLAQTIYASVALRSAVASFLVKPKTREQQLADWRAIDFFFADLELEVADVLAPMRFGGGWSKLKADEQVEVKQRFVEALSNRVTREAGTLYRARETRMLVAAYYAKSGRNPPKRQRVLTRVPQQVLSAFFGGDWLAFLNYLGERPHPDEQIVTNLPAVKLVMNVADRAADVAKGSGVPLEEVQRMLSAYLQTSSASSPVDQRLKVLREYWTVFDEIHRAQRAGMPSLWGLVEDRRAISFDAVEPDSVYHPGQFRTLLPNPLMTEIENLWGTTMLSRWPDVMVTEPFPNTALAEALGVALRFWHGCALTAWFIAEGEMSRTDMPGMQQYYSDALSGLVNLGCPVPLALFDELIKMDTQLGKGESVFKESSTSDVGHGITIRIGSTTTVRPGAFAAFKEIVDRYRTAWTESYIDSYLQGRAEKMLREAATEYHRVSADRGRAPTPKQFAKAAASATNTWFGGNLSQLFSAFGERAPGSPRRVRLMPADPEKFARAVRRRLASIRGATAPDDPARSLDWLAEESLRFVQLTEAMGQSPDLRVFGESSFAWRSNALASSVSGAWDIYTGAIESVRAARARGTLGSGGIRKSREQ